jgi:hypothetical protein
MRMPRRCRDPKSLLRALFAVINAKCFAGTQSSISAMAVRGLQIYRYDPEADANGGRPDSGPHSCRRADLERLCGKHLAQWSKNSSTMLIPYRYQVAGNLQFYSQYWSTKRNTLSAYTELPR